MKKRVLSFILAVVILLGAFPYSRSSADTAVTMRISQAGIDLIKGFEGFYAKAYWDYSQWTIGYGSFAGSNREAPDIATVTREEAETMLRTQIIKYEGYVNTFLNKYSIVLRQNQFDVLVSFTYNFGNVWDHPRYPDFNLKVFLINGISNYTDEEVTAAFTVWCHAGGQVLPGLVIRRQKEAAYFLSGAVQDPYSPENSLPTPLKCYAVTANDFVVKSIVNEAEITVNGAATEFTLHEIDESNKATVSFTKDTLEVFALCDLGIFIKTPFAHYTRYTVSAFSVYRRSDLAEPYSTVAAETAYSVVGETGNKMQIIYPLATGGYQMGWATKPAPNAFYTGRYTVNTADGSVLNIRSAASLTAGILGTMPNTTVFDVTAIDGEWGRTTYNKVSGWVYLDYCAFMFSLVEDYTVIASPSLNFRSSHDIADNKIGTIPSGTVIKVTDKYRSSAYLWGKTKQTLGGKVTEGWGALYSFGSSEYFAQGKTPAKLTTLSVTYSPNKKTYYEGESFNPAGIVITAGFSDGVWKRLSGSTGLTYSGYDSSPGNKTVIASYTYAGITKTASFGVEVKKNTPITGLTLNLQTAELNQGSVFSLKAAAAPANAADKSVNWTSSDAKTVSVSPAGAVAAIKAGQATITCASKITPAVTAQCVVTVLPAALIPGEFSALAKSNSTAGLSWAPAAGAAGYILYVSEAAAGPFTRLAETTSTDYLHTGMTCGREYFYKVRATRLLQNINIYEKPSAAISATPFPAVTGTPKAVLAGYNSVKTSWTASAGATGYVVYRSGAETGPYSKIKVTAALTFTDAGLATEKTYYYKFIAYASYNGKNTYGKPSAPVPVKVEPSVPGSFKAAPNSYNSIKISWKPVTGATGYVVYYASVAAGPFSRLKVTNLTSYVHTGLTCGKPYYYKLRAYAASAGKNNYSLPSAAISSAALPGVPGGFTAAKATGSSIKIKWAAVSGATGYVLYRADAGTGVYSRVEVTGSLSFTDTGLHTGKTYFYKIRAYRSVGKMNFYSPPSAWKSVKL